MKHASAPSYDLFKTIVTVILALILILMLLRGSATTATAPAQPKLSRPSPVPTEAILASDATETIVPSEVPPTEEPTTAAHSPTSTSAATEPPTTAAAFTNTHFRSNRAAHDRMLLHRHRPHGNGGTPTTAPDAATPAPVESASCNTVAPSRLSVGQKARVTQRLNVRSSASITSFRSSKPIPQIRQVEIIGGPTCTPVGDMPTSGGKSAWQMARRAGRQRLRSTARATSSNPFSNARDV